MAPFFIIKSITMYKYILFFLFFYNISFSQTLSYFEGRVLINSFPAKINAVLNQEDVIKTSSNSVAEITWGDRSKTLVEAGGEYLVKDLAGGQRTAVPSFAGFKNVFRSAKESNRAEEGGIRRSKVEPDTLPHPDQIYWKEDPAVSFEQAAAVYEKGDYLKAISLFKSFIDQKPFDPMSKYALYALGHCYVMVNNSFRAKQTFERFILKYADDPLRQDAEVNLTYIK